MTVRLILGDCLEHLQSLPSGSVDMVLCDLPYETTQNSWDSMIPLQPLWAEYWRVCTGPVVLTAQTPFDKVLGASQLNRLRYEWIWEKTEATGHLNAKLAPMKAHENVLVFYQSKPTYNPQKTQGHVRKTSTADRAKKLSTNYGQQRGVSRYDSTERYPRSVLKGPTDKQHSKLHPTQKPVWLMEYMIRTYTNLGDTVLDNTNRRGIRIDRASAKAALQLAEKAKKLLDREMKQLTDGAVTACSQVARLLAWITAQGVSLDSAAKAEITDLLETDDLPDRVRRALELRQEAAKTSVSKLSAMLKRANADGRVRGGFIYHQAGTGRTQSVGVNWNNMPRPRKDFDDAKPRSDVLFRAFRAAEPELLTWMYGPELGRPLHLISDAMRGFIWAAHGHDLIQADYSNIEGNVLAWSANEEWKLDAIREINADPANVPDMYRRTAAGILGLPLEEVTKKHWARQAVGKPAELGLGFGGGVMAFVTFARGYGVKLDGIAAQVLEQADEARMERAVKRYEGQAIRGLSGTKDLSRDAWIACEIIKLGWRAQNSAIVASWKDLEQAVRLAVQSPGTITTAAKAQYLVKHGFLLARLPSGRCLAYAAPRTKAQVWAKVRLPDGEWSESEVMDKEAAQRAEIKGRVKIEGPTSDKVTFLGVDSVTKKWQRSALYGGLIAENNTQAIARDILVNGMFEAEAAGYPIIATVYDEIIAEVPRGFGALKGSGGFEELICQLPSWAQGLPLTAGGWRGKRYRKD